MELVSQRTNAERPLHVFLSYAHEDEALCRELVQHLSFLVRAGSITVWHDRQIGPGAKWQGEISQHLSKADVILLLVSPAFGSSRYCWDVETRHALERHRTGEACVVPIILRPSEGWQDTPIGELQALPPDGKPITSWRPRDKGFLAVAHGLKTLLQKETGPSRSTMPELVSWSMVLQTPLTKLSEADRAEIALALRVFTRDLWLDLYGAEEGSARLSFRSTKPAYDALASTQRARGLDTLVGHPVLELSQAIGALIRIETTFTEETIGSSLTLLPDVFGGTRLGERMPPLVAGMAFQEGNWLQPGFKMVYAEQDGAPSKDELQRLQVRLGRYLNTFLVVAPQHHHVSLSPLAEHAGLPAPLARTELGRDLLLQDVVLKYYTACLLYPGSHLGAEFWRRLEQIAPAEAELDACMRVWIVPGPTRVKERMDQNIAHVDVEHLSLDARCATDHEALATIRRAQPHQAPVAGDQMLKLFRELILPEVQKEVRFGPHFGILRQIFSVLVLAAWIRKSDLAEPLRKAGLLDSNETARFHLDVLSDEVESLHRQYLEMFRNGVWRFGTTLFDLSTQSVKKRVLIAGGLGESANACLSLDLRVSRQPHPPPCARPLQSHKLGPQFCRVGRAPVTESLWPAP